MTEGGFQNLAVPGVQGLQPYQPGKPVSELERELGIRNIVKLASNENPLGPSPKVLSALQEALEEIPRYPDGNGYSLKKSLAEKYCIGIDQITLGNGSNDVLELVARTFLSPGACAIYSQYAFAVYPLVVQAIGAKGIVVSACNGSQGKYYGHNLEAMARQVTGECKVVFIANPNNPTGTYCNGGVLRDFLEVVPQQVIVVVDEAYFEYVEIDDYPDSLALLEHYPNLVVTRTFSKAYGLAGLRAGYAISSQEIADLLNRVREPFNVNSMALVGAEAALADQDYIQCSREINRQGLNQLMQGLGKLGIDYIPSVGNFLSFNCKRMAFPIYQGLLRQGVIVRPLDNYELPQHLRVTVGTARENTDFLEALAIVMAND